MSTHYIQITKADSKYFVDPWYKHAIGLIMPVAKYQGRVYFYEGLAVPQEDCTPYVFSTPELTGAQQNSLIAISKLLKDKNYPGHAQELEAIFPAVFPPPVTYQIGDRFRFGRIIYLLSVANEGHASLINIESGTRYTSPVAVECLSKITAEEFDKITGGDSGQFTKI